MGGVDATGVLGSVIQSAIHNPWQERLNRVQLDANLENCMVALGWEVVRVDDEEGARIAALPQTGQASALAPWVGAPAPHGVVVRTFAPFFTLPSSFKVSQPELAM